MDLLTLIKPILVMIACDELRVLCIIWIVIVKPFWKLIVVEQKFIELSQSCA